MRGPFLEEPRENVAAEIWLENDPYRERKLGRFSGNELILPISDSEAFLIRRRDLARKLLGALAVF